MATPKITLIVMQVAGDQLSVTATRDVSDSLTGRTEPLERTVHGKLSDLAGLATFRTNLVAWVKAQTGFAGTVDITP